MLFLKPEKTKQIFHVISFNYQEGQLKLRNEGDSISGMSDGVPSSSYAEVDAHDST